MVAEIISWFSNLFTKNVAEGIKALQTKYIPTLSLQGANLTLISSIIELWWKNSAVLNIHQSSLPILLALGMFEVTVIVSKTNCEKLWI